jgi:hypothetical protein
MSDLQVTLPPERPAFRNGRWLTIACNRASVLKPPPPSALKGLGVIPQTECLELP